MGQYHQDGQILLRSGVFYIRYNKNGKRVAEPLLHPDKSRVLQDDKKYRSVSSKAVVEIARAFMKPVNAATEKKGRWMRAVSLAVRSPQSDLSGRNCENWPYFAVF